MKEFNTTHYRIKLTKLFTNLTINERADTGKLINYITELTEAHVLELQGKETDKHTSVEQLGIFG